MSDDETKYFVEELSKKLKDTAYKFVLELKDQAGKISVPDGWRQLVNVILQDTAIAMSNVFTNRDSNDIIIPRDEETKALGQADVHVCALAVKNKKRYVLTMDASIWSALYMIYPDAKDRVRPIFSCLRLLFKDKPKTFVEALIMVIAHKKYKFARNLLDSRASLICFEDLIKSIDDVLQRYVSDLIYTKVWSSQKDNVVELMGLRERIRDAAMRNAKHNGELVFNDDQFINELNSIHTSLVSAGVTD